MERIEVRHVAMLTDEGFTAVGRAIARAVAAEMVNSPGADGSALYRFEHCVILTQVSARQIHCGSGGDWLIQIDARKVPLVVTISECVALPPADRRILDEVRRLNRLLTGAEGPVASPAQEIQEMPDTIVSIAFRT